MSAIGFRDVTKEYGDVTAVDDLTFEVKEGEIFGFLGPNGAGKSTSINILLDFIRPTRGSVSVFGMDSHDDSLAIRQRSGLLPEGAQLYKRLTARKHLEFIIEAKDADDDPEKLLEYVSLSDAVDRRAGGFSKGMQQRLALAMALVGDPDLLILDEPSTGLDPTGADEFLDIIRAENDSGTTVFFSSHVLGQIETICDRVGIMRGGKLVTSGSIPELRDSTTAAMTLEVTIDSVTEKRLEAVRELGPVTSVTTRDRTLRVKTTGGAETLVLNTLEESGATIESILTRKPSLEDLFMEHVEGGRDTGQDSDDPVTPTVEGTV